jgi:hypothetical protein
MCIVQYTTDIPTMLGRLAASVKRLNSLLTFFVGDDILAAIGNHVMNRTMHTFLIKQVKQSKKPDRTSG